MHNGRSRWWRFAFACLAVAACGTLGACNTIAGLGRDLTAIGEGTAHKLGVQDDAGRVTESRASFTD